jgi:aspartyl-tRNA synthetase
VIRVMGEVRQRPEGTVNSGLSTGDVEVAVRTVEVLAVSDTPPFPVEDRIEADELLRLTYRYLDLRRPEMTRVLQLRHAISRIIRDHMEGLAFVEVETPFLTRSTPEGARDFLVPARLWPGNFYALPQSPQQLKQLLMVAGQDRYYQIVRCLRDEAPRADRSFEFTQLDMEMSFVNEEDVFRVIEPLYARIVAQIKGVELADLGEAFARTGFRAIAAALSQGGVVKGFAAPGGSQLSRRELDELVQLSKERGAAGLVWMVVEDKDVIRSPVERHVTPEEAGAAATAMGAAPGDLMLIVADRTDRTNVALDGLRRRLAARLGLVPDGEWRFCWMVEPPLFEWSEDERKWVSVHHPFTAPASDDLSPETATARGYDLVLNGFELGGGSIRIHDPDIQRRVFEVLGLTPEETEEKFGHLLRAFRYGVPPHGGIAMGLDRLAMLMAGKDTLRDVTAFPKAQSGADPLTGAPAPVPEEPLRELGIKVIARPETMKDGGA